MSQVAKNLIAPKFADVRRGYLIPKTLSNEDALSVCAEAEGEPLTNDARSAMTRARRYATSGGMKRQVPVSTKIDANRTAARYLNQLVQKQITYEFALMQLKSLGICMSERTLRRQVMSKRTQLVTKK
jgi:hypothetical protein